MLGKKNYVVLYVPMLVFLSKLSKIRFPTDRFFFGKRRDGKERFSPIDNLSFL